MRVLIVQMGARHGYTLARQLNERGLLGGLYTDAAFRKSWKVESLLRKIGMSRHSAVVRRRQIDDRLWGKTFPNLMVNILSGMGGRISPRKGGQLEDVCLGLGGVLGGRRNCDIVYAMFGSGEIFLNVARRQGALIVNEMFITPVAHLIEDAERVMFPEWGETRLSAAALRVVEEKVRRVIKLSDALFCPAPAVIEGLRHYEEFDESKAALVPYGSSVSFRELETPRPGRVLFAGTVCLRKGAQYLGAASRLLKTKGSAIDVVAAGGVSDRVRALPSMNAVTFLGHLGRTEMDREFSEADVFVLPSLAEGSASVVFEAMAAGLPVVVTPGAGSVVTHGKEGFIVPERDPEALAAAIERIVSDRSLRESMSQASQETAALYDEKHWGDRLVEALSSVLAR